MDGKTDPKLLAAAGLGAAILGRKALQRGREVNLRGKTALVTGGSRGLGFLIARELAREGCRVVICARNEPGVRQAAEDLQRQGANVLAIRCDVSDREQVDRMVEAARRHFGGVDILVNNAGIMDIGPVESMTVADFEAAMGVQFWGVLFPTLAVLPFMQRQRSGWIVNITSIGGRISAPHLLPYNSAKFAAVGLSEGLRAELAKDGIAVTTVCPGFMRTGSYLNALFKSKQEAEFTWFGLCSALPIMTMDAERAARQIVRAAKRGQAETDLTFWAPIAARFHGLFPGTTANLLSLFNRMLPAYGGRETEGERGMEVEARMDSALFRRVTRLGRSAAERFHEFPGTKEVLTGPAEDRPVQAG